MKGRSRTAPLAMALVALCTLGTAGCDVVFQGLNAQATDQWTRTYKLDEGGQVEVISPNGQIEVSPSADASTVEVVAERRVHAATEEAARQELSSIKINERVTPRQITVEVPSRKRGRYDLQTVTFWQLKKAAKWLIGGP